MESENKVKRQHPFIKTVLILILSVVLGSVMLMAAYALPVSGIDENVVKSAHIIQREGAYPILTRLATSQLDNWTDAIMLAESAYDNGENLLNKAMNISRGAINGMNSPNALVAHYVDSVDYDYRIDYQWYWHGYLVVLKPLLLFLDYGGVRIVNGILQLLICVLICLLLHKNNLDHIILPYVLCYLSLMPLALALSLQYSACYYVFSFALLYLLNKKKKGSLYSFYTVFLATGIATAYFDFLTYPMATFGMVEVMSLILTSSKSFRDNMKNMVKNGIGWCVGYGVMWISKWIVASFVLGENVVFKGLGEFFYRTSNVAMSGNGTTSLGRFQCLYTNIKAYVKTPVTLLMLSLVVYLIYVIVKKQKKTLKDLIIFLLPYIVVAMAPVVWYMFALNHSTIHCWFTNKALVVSAFSVIAGLAKMKALGDLELR